MKKLLSLLLFCAFFSAQAQFSVEEVESGILKEKRTLKIYKPVNYTEEKVYPLIIVFDADYLFEPLVANINYYSYWLEMPEAIIVGVNQKGIRYEDCEYSGETGLPDNKGNDFFDFVGLELIPYIESQYTIANFRVAVGHGTTANFINYYLFKDAPLFNAYINLSPTFAPQMEERIASRLGQFKEKKFYYLATAENDEKKNRTKIGNLNTMLKQVKNNQLYYYYDDFESANHNSTAVYAIPNALNKIFGIFKPITPAEYKEKILTMEEPVINYLNDKYNTIEDLFGFKKEILINDYMAIYAACKKKEDAESLRNLAELAEQDYPATMMYDYLMGEYYEQIGNPKKAVKHFQEAFAKEEIDFMTKDLAYEKMQAIKNDFGY
ncbi:hypothetical protein SAMN05216480_10910 [Pustulibacterium marinum]|uniref:Esterase n=1 Tax=Pustulibacterium marinum TaxID=1224947 RepID=A0A1I7HFG9_9FLAO|nr:alpha/beta hydrolase-fold protein [Pustulibacterium marinum]SFU59381.1 hypothetical protein SAMN05216480_10910 [Pustulibacterium marinum]